MMEVAFLVVLAVAVALMVDSAIQTTRKPTVMPAVPTLVVYAACARVGVRLRKRPYAVALAMARALDTAGVDKRICTQAATIMLGGVHAPSLFKSFRPYIQGV